ncbi:MAG: anaerobic ribonucleoside-triphosphate reductase activating protein [Chlamydiota bacterium]
MKIAGFNHFTLSDYPGKVAAIIFTQGCNFRCPFCHNSQLMNYDLKAQGEFSATEILDYLDHRRHQLDGVVITGGEPTVQHDLPEFITRIKEYGYNVKLDTNGSIPVIIKKLINDGLVDYIAMDIKAPLDKYHELAGTPVSIENIEESIALIAQSGIDHEFRTTNVEQLLSQDDLIKIRTLIPLGSKHYFQNFIAENAMCSSLAQSPT